MKQIFRRNPVITILSVLLVVQSVFLLRAYYPKSTISTTVSSVKTNPTENELLISNFSYSVNGKEYACSGINEEDKNNINAYSNLVAELEGLRDQNVQKYVEKINNCGTEKEFESSPEMEKIWDKYPDIKADYDEYQWTKTYTIDDFQECKKFWGKAINESDTSSSAEIGKWESEIEKLLTKNNCEVKQQTAKQAETGYIRIFPRSIKAGEKVSFEYGYKDPLNNEHLQSAVTTVEVKAPSKKTYTSKNAKIYPDDFTVASTSEKGIYRVNVERTVETVTGNKDVLYSASSLFAVSED